MTKVVSQADKRSPFWDLEPQICEAALMARLASDAVETANGERLFEKATTADEAAEFATNHLEDMLVELKAKFYEAWEIESNQS